MIGADVTGATRAVVGAPIAIPHALAVELGHALVARVASELGVRALLIKGPIATRYGLRPQRVSADVDVLVEPGGVDAISAALVARGWHPPVQRNVPRVLAAHSVTLVNDEWPCAIDVHRTFPGVFAEPEVAFEAFWEKRKPVDVANQRVLAPARSGMALLLALHSLRNPGETRSRFELSYLVEVVGTEFSRSERDELVQLASVARAQWVIRETLAEALGARLEDDATPLEKRTWQLNQLSTPAKSSYLWRREVVLAVKEGRADRLWRAVWVRRADVPRSIVSQLPSRREHWRYQIERWSRAVRIFLGRESGVL